MKSYCLAAKLVIIVLISRENPKRNSQPDEGGDEIVLDYRSIAGMDILRIVVRLCTSQSDVQAAMASTLVYTHKDWTGGATRLGQALVHVRKALELADAQISKWYQQRQEMVVFCRQGQRRQAQDNNADRQEIQGKCRQPNGYRYKQNSDNVSRQDRQENACIAVVGKQARFASQEASRH